MNDRQIECFLEAARYLNFTRAAENMKLPQPAVSRYIASLESELGTNLFKRESNRKIILTAAGKAYYNLFRRTYLELDRTRQALSNSSPALRLGINKDWHMPDFLPKVVDDCRRKNPDFRITYECLDFRALNAGMQEKRLDAVISLENYLAESPDLSVARLTSIQRLLIYSELLPDFEQIRDPSDLYRYDFLIADDPRIRKLVEESETIFQAYHFVPRFRTVPNTETVLFYVESGAGVALLDSWCYALHRPHLRHIQINEHIPVAMAWQRESSNSSAELFRECLNDCFQSELFNDIQ